jgi:hypothetical protein
MALALSAVAACPATAADSRGLAPITPWILDYATDSCAIRRMFGEGKNQAYIEFRRFQPGLELQTTVASNRMKATRSGSFRYRFDEATGWRESGIANALKMADGFSGVLFSPSFMNLPEYDELDDQQAQEAYLQTIDWRTMEKEAAAGVESITLSGAFPQTLTLQFGPLDKPIAALNQCINELMTHWGIDVEAHKSLTRQAAPINLPDASKMVDYPPKMLRQGMPGLVNVRLAIDERGRITACHIQMPLSDAAFEESSCADIEHALEFDPALDKDGKPIASYWVTRVIFQIDR